MERGCPEMIGVGSRGAPEDSVAKSPPVMKGSSREQFLEVRGSGVEEKFVRNFPPDPLYIGSNCLGRIIRPPDNPALLGADNPACRHHFSNVSKRTLVCIRERWF